MGVKAGDLAVEQVKAKIVESNSASVMPKEEIMKVQNIDDPYDTPEEHAECNDFIFKTFFWWTGEAGTFSTWRERHIGLRGFHNGFNTGLTDKFTDVPDMWKDEGQYYEFGQECGYVIRNALIFGFSGVATGAVGTEVALNMDTIMTVLRTLIGA